MSRKKLFCGCHLRRASSPICRRQIPDQHYISICPAALFRFPRIRLHIRTDIADLRRQLRLCLETAAYYLQIFFGNIQHRYR